MLETGQTYERSAITKWLARGESTGVLTCPKSRLPLKTKTLTINWSLRAVIQDWWNEHAIEVRKVGEAWHLRPRQTDLYC